MIAAGLLLLCCGAGCKPTEKNYRSAYDVARGKRDRDNRQREELRRDMGIGGDVMQEVDGAALARVDDREVWVRHVAFPAADSVATYAVSIATFRMPANAASLAADMRAEGFGTARAVKGADRHFVIIGESSDTPPAIEIMEKFSSRHPDWQYVGQPGIMLIIGGSK